MDLDSDLGLGKDKTTPGFFFDYQGPRFGFQVSTGAAEYRGDRIVTRTITVDGQDYDAGTRVQSRVKLASVDGIWTIRIIRGSAAWLGLDLGVQAGASMAWWRPRPTSITWATSRPSTPSSAPISGSFP